jgi:hypothetical protein
MSGLIFPVVIDDPTAVEARVPDNSRALVDAIRIIIRNACASIRGWRSPAMTRKSRRCSPSRNRFRVAPESVTAIYH